eukprot:183170-Chlamydomonas_euryale.AAC.7
MTIRRDATGRRYRVSDARPPLLLAVPSPCVQCASLPPPPVPGPSFCCCCGWCCVRDSLVVHDGALAARPVVDA